ncbi:MAG: dihydrodipicolinate synthase family protein [Armatimonadota bacterium]
MPPLAAAANSGCSADLRAHLLAGQVIPAHPLALDESRRLDERRQQALTRYYLAAGAGGIAVGVHTTQFAIRERGLYRPVLELAAETAATVLSRAPRPLVKIAGLCGPTPQAVREAQIARALGYDAGLLSLAWTADQSEDAVLEHCRAVAELIPLFGFYLQSAVGGRTFGYQFWRRFAEIENVVAIKVAPFNRYQTLDVVRAVMEAGRDDIALYTGNDDNIILDLLTSWELNVGDERVRRFFAGGLLGHWAVWTRQAVMLLEEIKAAREQSSLAPHWLTRAIQVTDANAAFFDAAHEYAGCVAGLHEVLRRQGLLAGNWCLAPNETLSPGQAAEIDRVYRAYPDQNDDRFVAAHLDDWLR